MNTLHLSEDFKATDFLQQYWQKKPVLLKGLIADFCDVVTPEELAGLACEKFIESRLVTEFEAANWQLRTGPFTNSDFSQLPDSNWTLLVQAVDQWFEEVADIKTLFNFIPSWRVEDIMISYATPGGNVGPHFDYYDVFLVQGLGRRRWQIGPHCGPDSQLRDNTDLGILQNFESAQEFQLKAGDALYIPPRYAHWGIAETESLCYSVGFRAPSLAEMIEGFSDFLIAEQDPSLRYEDQDLLPVKRRGEIEPTLLDSSFQMLHDQFAEKHKFISWFGCYVSQTKYPELVQALDTPFASEEFTAMLKRGLCLQHNPCSRFAFIESKVESCTLCFVDGAMVKFELGLLESIASICAEGELDPTTVSKLAQRPEIAELLRRLLNQGSLLLSE